MWPVNSWRRLSGICTNPPSVSFRGGEADEEPRTLPGFRARFLAALEMTNFRRALSPNVVGVMLTVCFLTATPAFAQVTENASPTGEIDLQSSSIPPEHVVAAVEAARAAIAEHPDSAEVSLQLGIALRSAGDQAGADQAIQRALSLNPH